MVSVQIAKWTEEGREVGGCVRGLSMHCKPSVANWGSIISLKGNSLWICELLYRDYNHPFERTAVESLLLFEKGFHSGKQLEVGAGKLRGKKGLIKNRRQKQVENPSLLRLTPPCRLCVGRSQDVFWSSLQRFIPCWMQWLSFIAWPWTLASKHGED